MDTKRDIQRQIGGRRSCVQHYAREPWVDIKVINWLKGKGTSSGINVEDL
jgi:hypothetical protein